ncbi:MAG: peptidoglycan-binding protein LysM [Bacteroidetes bacterium]|nr:peptidoglycan-binding protein LysM [Bacteroidota bacterium]
MKHNLFKTSLLLIVALGVTTGFSFKEKVDLSHYKMDDLQLCYHVPTEDEVNEEQSSENFDHIFLGKTYIGFKEALGFKESSGDYFIINKYGYLGKYQFGKNTLKLIGIYDASSFIYDSHLQEKAFSANTSRNKWILRRDINNYVGRYVGGIKITESGILAAAHLAGAGNVKKYLRSGGTITFNDAFGTSIKYYLKKFSGYDTSFVVANKKAKV